MSLPTERKLVVLTDMATGKQEVVDATPHFLDQGEWWRTRDGRDIRVEDMTESHVRNLIAYLHRQARRFHTASVLRMGVSLDGPLGPRGEMASYYAESEYDELCWQNPSEWLDETELLKALRARLA